MNNFVDFEQFCLNRNITLYDEQKECAKILFSVVRNDSTLPAGKSLLIALLAAYDPAFQGYYNTIVNYHAINGGGFLLQRS